MGEKRQERRVGWWWLVSERGETSRVKDTMAVGWEKRLVQLALARWTTAATPRHRRGSFTFRHERRWHH